METTVGYQIIYMQQFPYIFMGVSFMLVWKDKFCGGRLAKILKLLFNNQFIKIITNTVRRHAERLGFICCLLEKSAQKTVGQ